MKHTSIMNEDKRTFLLLPLTNANNQRLINMWSVETLSFIMKLSTHWRSEPTIRGYIKLKQTVNPQHAAAGSTNVL